MRFLVLAAAVLLAASPALAQLRNIPAEAKRATVREVQANAIDLDGDLLRLAPGAQIRDAGNFIIFPAALPAGVLVRYITDTQGLLFRVWVLSPQEAAQRDTAPAR